MDIEIEITELLDMLAAADKLGLEKPLEGVTLYNPNMDTESRVLALENGMFFLESQNGGMRKVPVASLSTWSAIISPNSILNNDEILNSTRSTKAKKYLSKLHALSLPTGSVHNVDDLEIILSAWSTPLTQTNLKDRLKLYSAVKKLENEAGRTSDSYRLGLALMERWNILPIKDSPPDFMIHLAYYRRWNRLTNEALEVSKIIDSPDAEKILTKHEISILATERAAAFMDLYEKTGSGLNQALRYLKYHHKIRSGSSDEHNTNACKRYENFLKKQK